MSDLKPRILLVTPQPPFPPDNGGMLRIFTIARRLRDTCDISLLTYVRKTGDVRFKQNAAMMALRGVFKDVYAVDREATFRGARPPFDLPAVAADWYSPEMAETIARLTKQKRFDAVHIEFLQMAFYARYVSGARTILTEHDLGHLSLFKSYFREWTGLARFARIGDWWRVRRYHRETCRRFDRLVALTTSDAKLLGDSAPADKIRLIPTCVDLEKFAFRPEEKEDRDIDMAFVGHYPHFPNEDAARWFCGSVLGRIKKKRPSATLSLIGSSPTDKVRALAGPGVEVTGTVPDVRPYLDRSKIFVVPVRLGFGIKGKVLEAFARGLPVVATSVVVRGIPEAVSGTHLLQADSPADFARETERLLSDSALRSRMAAAARSLVEKYYGWEKSVTALNRMYAEIMPGRSRARVEAPA